jgi:hypothetical protein
LCRLWPPCGRRQNRIARSGRSGRHRSGSQDASIISVKYCTARLIGLVIARNRLSGFRHFKAPFVPA